MKKIFYIYRTARQKKYINVKKFKEPDHVLYGLNYLQKKGYKVTFSDMAYSKWNVFRILFFLLEQYIIKKTSIGFKIDQALILLPNIFKSDLIVTTTDSAGLPVLFLKYFKIIDKPIIYISTGLINELSQRKNTFFFNLYKKILPTADIIICHAPIEVKLYKQHIPILQSRLKVVPFGIDNIFFRCDKKRKNQFIFSVGQDRSRDFKLLAEIAKKLPDESFVVVTQKSNVRNINFTQNVKVYFNLPYSDVKNFYCQAKMVLLTLKEINRASGQINFLESVASNNKLCVSPVKGLIDTYPLIFANKKDLLILENKVKDVNKIKALLKKPNKNLYRNPYSSRRYAASIERIINSL